MAANEDQILLSDLADGKTGIFERISDYTSILGESLDSLNQRNTIIEKFLPFLTKAFKILSQKLVPRLKGHEQLSGLWFKVFKLCVSRFEIISQFKSVEVVKFRCILLLCFTEWGLWEEGELEALTIFKKLKPKDCNNVYLPTCDPKAGFRNALARTVGLLCVCVANYKPMQSEHYSRIQKIVSEFWPWIRVLDKGPRERVLNEIMPQLLTITICLVSEVIQFDSKFDIASKICQVIISTPVQRSHYLNTKLCDSLYQIGGQMHSNNDLQQALDIFTLHCEVTWVIIEAKLKEADILVFYGKWCEGIQSLFQVLTKFGCTPRVQGLIEEWTRKWTAEKFCTTLPGPISLVEQWVKIQVEIIKCDGNSEDVGTLLGNMFIPLSKAERKKILQQELLFYVQMQEENHHFCTRMQTVIIKLLQEDGFNKPVDWLEGASSLNLCGIKGSNYCIQYLSQAVEVSHGHQLAAAYALRSLCTDESKPNSEKAIQDIQSALLVGSSIHTSDYPMEPSNLMNILYTLLDSLSLKGRVDLHCDIYKVMIDLYNREGVPLKNLRARLWESRRISHALCPSPIQEEFINLHEHFGKELKLTQFWIPLVGFENNFLPSNSSKTSDDEEKIASELLSRGSESGNYSASCIYYDLSQKVLSTGHSIEALRYAREAYQLRVKLFTQKFSWTYEGCGEEYNETGSHTSVHRLSVRELLSFNTHLCALDTFYVSPWKALQCYLESILQLGIIHEILGNATKAISFLDRGKSLACSHNLILFSIVFSSCLGELHHKEHQWALAEQELQSAKELLNDIEMDGFCSRCRSILDVTIANSLANLYQNWIEGTSFRRSPSDLYKEALAKLYTSEWKRSVTCPEDEDVTVVLEEGDDSVECDFPNNLCQNNADWYLDLQNCVVSSGVDKPCICKTKGCLHCAIEKSTRSVFVSEAIKLKWELVHRRLSHKLLTGLGKYLENDGQIHEACEITFQSISVIVGQSSFCRASKSTFLPDMMGKEITLQRKHLNLYHLLGSEIAEDLLCLERAVILYNLCCLSLKERKKDIRYHVSTGLLPDTHICNRNNPHVLTDIPISKLVSWLMLAFVLSREFPAVFKKVSRLLAAIFSLSTSSLLEASLSTSCQDLCERHWVCFFHQASLGVQFNHQFFIKEVEQHADTKASHMALGLQKFPRLAPKSVLNLVDFVSGFFGGLPDTTIICLSILGSSHTCMFQELLSCSTASSWIMISRLNHKTLPIHVVLPVHPLSGGNSNDTYSLENDGSHWCCPWGSKGSTVVDDVVPNFRFLMEEFSYLLNQPPDSRAESTFDRIDNSLRQLLEKMENSWFESAFKCMFLGEFVNCKPVDLICESLVREFSEIDFSTLKVMMHGLIKYGFQSSTYRTLLKICLKKGCYFNDTCDEHRDNVMDDFASKLHKAVTKIKRGIVERSKPIIIVPDFDVQMLPWESLPTLRSQEVYRMPSVWTILEAYKNERTINPLSAYYLLNPDGSLSSNSDLEKLCKDKKLKGKFKYEPTAKDLAKSLENQDLFIYLGHGSGSKYISNHLIKTLPKCAGAILCGCNSCALELGGEYVPLGPPLSYLLAGSPFVIGFLWTVLEFDVTRFAHAILSAWFKDRAYRSDSGQRQMIGTCMNQARNKCSRFPYLVGASQVCYGIPTEIKATNKPRIE